MLSEHDIRVLAEALLKAEQTRQPIPPLTHRVALTEDEAYRVQDLRVALSGGRVVGYKLGFTSAAMRAQMAVREPNYGRLLEGMRLQSPHVYTGRFIHPRIEPEVALEVGQALQSPVSLQEVRQAVRRVYPALEVVDSRYQDYRFTAEDNIADNSSAAAFILGTPRTLAEVEPRMIPVLLYKNCVALDSGSGSDAMGDPLSALGWLVDRLGRVGRRLEADMLVLTGGLTRAHPALPGDRFLADFGPLGTVSLVIEG